MLLRWIYGWIPEGSALHDAVLSYFNPLLCPFMPLVPFPEWLSHLYELTAEKDSDWEGSGTPMSAPWARSADGTSPPFPELAWRTLSDLFYSTLQVALQTDRNTTLQNTYPAPPNTSRPQVSAAEAVLNLGLGMSKQQHDRQLSWLNLDTRQIE